MAITILIGSITSTYLLSRYFNHSNYALVALTWIPLFLAGIIAHKCWYIFVYPYYSPFRHLPAPDQGPLLKRLFKEPFANQHAIWINEIPNDGLIRYHGAFNGERLLVTHPDGIKDVLTLQPYHYIKQPFAVRVTRRVTGMGLVVANQEEHKFQRQLFQPVFKFKNIRDLSPMFWTGASGFLKILDREIPVNEDGKRPMSITKWGAAATMDVFARTAFSGTFNALEDPNSKTMKDFKLLISPDPFIKYYKWALILPYYIWRRLPMKDRHALDHIIKDNRETLKSFIHPAQQKRGTTIVESLSCQEKSESRVDIMARILESGHPFTDEQLLDHVATFLIAGHDTTAGALSYTLYQLSRHPQIQAKLRAEVRSKLPSPDSGAIVDSTLTESLPYLTACVLEGVRLGCPVPHVRRQVYKRGATILGYSIPLGTTVSTSPWALNRSKELWGSDALEYQPERWIRADTGKIDWLGGAKNPYSNNSFGHGPRTCIGERYAKAEVAAFIAGLVGRFEWEWKGAGEEGLDSEPTWITSVTSKAQGGLWFNMQKVDGW